MALSTRQKAAFVAFVDALLPPKTGNDGSNPEFWEFHVGSDPKFVETVETAIVDKMSSANSFQTQVLLTALSTAMGTSLIFGVASTSSFVDWSIQDRIEAVRQLQYSPISHRRKIFQGLKQLLLGIALSYESAKGSNPLWKCMEYPGPPTAWQIDVVDQEQVEQATKRQEPIQRALIDATSMHGSTMECDIVIVGSGSGGCVAASVLAQAGYQVIVVEKGHYLRPDEITLSEADAMDRQYEQHGLLQTTDGAMMILAGSGLGGGTAINWSCCLSMPEYVRDEWVQVHGLDAFGTAEYETALQHVMRTIGAADKSKVVHSVMNKKFQKGCDALGFHWETTGQVSATKVLFKHVCNKSLISLILLFSFVGQNLKDCEDVAAGFIGIGDRYGNKEGGIQAFLVKAVDHGAKVVENCRVRRVLRRTDGWTSKSRITGVECQVGNACFTIQARRSVVLTAGALQTPLILQRSGFRNRHIGKHLRLHPVTGVFGLSASNEHIDGILGPPMTTVCSEFSKENGGYGVKIETGPPYPGLLGATMPWVSPESFRRRALQYRHVIPLVLLQRDSGEGGTVRNARDEKGIVIDYKVNELDRGSLHEAIKRATRILWASGMQEIGSCHVSDTGIRAPSSDSGTNHNDDPLLNQYLEGVHRRGMKDLEIGLFSAHQMGTCRMSTSPSKGAVDVNGECWDCDGVYVMDTSVFPTASGSNPMVTVLTTAYMLSARLSLTLKLEEEREKGVLFLHEDQRQRAAQLLEIRQKLRAQSMLPTHRWAVFVLVPVFVALILGWLLEKVQSLHTMQPVKE
jgi:choline dehydrogenase-like flavoprotein